MRTDIELAEGDAPKSFSPRRGGRRSFVSAGVVVLVVCLLYFSLRSVHLGGIWHQLARLRLWQIVAILGLDGLIYVLIGARWWLLVRVENPGLRLIEAVGVRLLSFWGQLLHRGTSDRGRALAGAVSAASTRFDARPGDFYRRA